MALFGMSEEEVWPLVVKAVADAGRMADMAWLFLGWTWRDAE